MKKSLLLILASLFTVFALTGCADEEKNDTPVITQPMITQPTLSESDLKSLKGTYDIEFFYTDATVATLTNDCSKLQEYVGSDAKKCSDIANQRDSEMQGKGSIDVSNGHVKIITKVQLDGGGFNNPAVAQVEVAKNQKYNYTVYNKIPVSAVKDNYLNLDNVTKGTTGRNAVSLAGSEDDTYNITIKNGIVIINMFKDTGISFAKTAPVVVRMKKVSDNVEPLDPNTAFPTPDISNIFKADIGYNIKADIGYNN